MCVRQATKYETGGMRILLFIFPKFERTLAEAQISTESNCTKISFLKGTLNRDIRRAMIGKVRTTYIQFAAELQLIGSQLDRLYQSEKRAGEPNERSNSKDRPRGQERNTRDSRQEQGDKPPAKWVPSKELIRRGERNVCFRYERDGHRIRCSSLLQRK